MNGDIIKDDSIPDITELPGVPVVPERPMVKMDKHDGKVILFQGCFPEGYLYSIYEKFKANHEFVILKCKGAEIRYVFELVCMASQHFKGVEIYDIQFIVDRKERDCKKVCDNSEVTFKINNPNYSSKW